MANAPSSTSQSKINYSMKRGSVSQSRGSSQIMPVIKPIKMCDVSTLHFLDLELSNNRSLIDHSSGLPRTSPSSKSRKNLSYLRVHMRCYLNEQPDDPDLKRSNTGTACEIISKTIFVRSQPWHSSLSPAAITGR